MPFPRPRVAQNFSEEWRRRPPSNKVSGFDPLLETGSRKEALAISDRGRRVLVYTAALLLAPLPVMPFEKGTREFAWAVAACGAALAAASYYAARGEWRLRHRGLPGNKLLAASLITLAFGLALLAGSFVYLSGF